MADIITKTCRAIVKRGSEKPPHGGKRPGAGRPPKAEGTSKKSDLRSIRIPNEEWDDIKTAASNMQLTASEFLRRAAREYGCIPS